MPTVIKCGAWGYLCSVTINPAVRPNNVPGTVGQTQQNVCSLWQCQQMELGMVSTANHPTNGMNVQVSVMPVGRVGWGVGWGQGWPGLQCVGQRVHKCHRVGRSAGVACVCGVVQCGRQWKGQVCGVAGWQGGKVRAGWAAWGRCVRLWGQKRPKQTPCSTTSIWGAGMGAVCASWYNLQYVTVYVCYNKRFAPWEGWVGWEAMLVVEWNE